MAVMRAYRNIEYTLVDFITTELAADGWSGVRVNKTYKDVEAGNLPVIVVSFISTEPRKKQIGERTLSEKPLVIIRIFALNDGQRLDLAKWLLDKLSSSDIVYYEYTIVRGVSTEKTPNGYINILSFLSNMKEYEGQEDLPNEDKFRHKISFTISVRGLS